MKDMAQTERQIFILLLLSENKRGYTINDIHASLKKWNVNVDKKTIMRDIDSLSSICFISEEERNGKTYYTADKFRLSDITFTSPELISLAFMMELLKPYQYMTMGKTAYDLIQKLLDNSKWQSNGAFLVYNQDGTLLASTNPDYNNIDLSGYLNIDGFFNLKYEDTEYICKIIQSNNTKCYYASITPKKLATEPISSLQKMALFFALIIIPLGLLISYLLSQRNYTPLKRLIEWINDKAIDDGESFERGNEIDILEKVLHLSFEEQEKLITQIHNRKNELIVSSMRNLLYGTCEQGDSIDEVFKRNDLSLLSIGIKLGFLFRTILFEMKCF